MSAFIRGEVWALNFDPSVGSEMKKIRPAVVISDQNIGKLPLRIVVPITEWDPRFASYPWFVHLLPNKNNGLTKESGADAFSVKSLSERRFVRKLGQLTDNEVEEIAAAIALCVGFSIPGA